MLRRVSPWQAYPDRTGADPRRLTAIHEAGHVVLMRWVGLDSPSATIEQTDRGFKGEANWPTSIDWDKMQAPPPDDGTLAATAASVWHAGVMAEQLELGLPWLGPIHYPHATDYQQAEKMLHEDFGSHCSGAHAYAQQVARAVLAADWPSVLAVAQELEQTGRWLG